MLDEIAKFLRARIDDTERIARAAHPIEAAAAIRWKAMKVPRRVPGNGLRPMDTWCVFTDPRELHIADTSWRPGVVEHIVRHDPARALRKVAADRKLVDEVTGWQHERLHDGDEANAGPYPCSPDGTTCDCGLQARQEAVLRLLALPDAAHPKYRQEWAA